MFNSRSEHAEILGSKSGFEKEEKSAKATSIVTKFLAFLLQWTESYLVHTFPKFCLFKYLNDSSIEKTCPHSPTIVKLRNLKFNFEGMFWTLQSG